MTPYTAAHIDVPGVTNYLISTAAGVQAPHGRLPGAAPSTATSRAGSRTSGEMSAPEVRAVIWAKVEEITDAVRRGEHR